MPNLRKTCRRLPLGLAASLAALGAVALLGPGGPAPVPSGFGGGAGLAGPESADACGVLPVSVRVKSKYPQAYARDYGKRVPIEVTNRGGYRIGGLVVQLYTFGGLRIGSSPALGSLRSGGTRKAVVRLSVPVQAGKVTFVAKGANKGCSVDEISHVVTFRSCQTLLPVVFPSLPGGYASDYSDFLSLAVEAKEGQPIFQPRSRVYGAGGGFVGQDVNRYRVIYGKVRFDNRLSRPLVPGSYTLIVRGWLNQPRSCGPKTARVSLGFK